VLFIVESGLVHPGATCEFTAARRAAKRKDRMRWLGETTLDGGLLRLSRVLTDLAHLA
jgi:hypothetical protein